MLKVIIADDERLICRLVQMLADWDSLGMEVVAMAENGLEALELVQSKRPDILITDIRMPGCDGLELIRSAKQIMPDLEVVIISGYAHFEYAQSAMRYGAGYYLLKPIKQAELMETLEKIREKCESRLETMASISRQHQNSQKDLRRIRESLVKDLMTTPTELTAEALRDIYHVETYGGIYQVFMVKIDGSTDQVSRSGLEVMQEKIKDIFSNSLAPVCHDMLLYFQSCTGCGVMNYDPAKKDEVRRGLRECLNHLEVKRSLLGPFEFSVSLGIAVDAPEKMPLSLESARNAMTERLIQGTGRLLDTVPPGSGIEKQNLLDKYVKVMEHTVDSLSTAEAGEACRMLETEALGLDHICGREILELVLSAGRLFIARTALSNVEEIQQEFVNSCSQCRTAGELFGQLARIQERLLSEARELRSSEAARPIRIAKQYVMQHFDEPITLETVCEDIGFSVNYFSMLFKRETGEGFAKYLTRVRIEEAKTLLRETGIPIPEIWEQAGYSDRNHFTHTCHKATGLNPVEYRKLYG